MLESSVIILAHCAKCGVQRMHWAARDGESVRCDRCLEERRTTDVEKALVLKSDPPVQEPTFLGVPDVLRQEGREARASGAGIEDCPYDEGTDGEFGWKAGWKDADSGVTSEPRS